MYILFGYQFINQTGPQMNFLIYLILAFSKTEHFFNFQSSGDMSMSHQMPMNRMSQQQQQQQSSQQQQQQQQGMVGPPGSSNGPGVGNSMMSNGSDMHQQMSINQVQQNFANNQYGFGGLEENIWMV